MLLTCIEEVFGSMKNGVFWVVPPCGSCKNLLTTATRGNNPEDVILHSHRHENLDSCIFDSNLCRYTFCPDRGFMSFPQALHVNVGHVL
jgi:hypothetical protein